MRIEPSDLDGFGAAVTIGKQEVKNPESVRLVLDHFGLQDVVQIGDDGFAPILTINEEIFAELIRYSWYHRKVDGPIPMEVEITAPEDNWPQINLTPKEES